MYSEDEEMNRLIDEAADEYQTFEELLKQNEITFEEALSAAEAEQSRFFDTLCRYGIKHGDIEHVCLDVAELLKKEKNDDILFLYISLLSETGLFFENVTDDEQKIMMWLEHHKHAGYIQERIRAERILQERFDNLIKHKPVCSLAVCTQEDLSLLHEISKEHSFISKNINDIYLENLGELIRKVNGDALYSRIKPYIYSAVISRKYKYMVMHRNYSPNIHAVFKRWEYTISKNNGKNFNRYKAYIELYRHMREVYANESDIALSDYCFANLSNLSEWFYENCGETKEIPVTLRQFIEAYASYLEFWRTGFNGDKAIPVKDILTNAAAFIV